MAKLNQKNVLDGIKFQIPGRSSVYEYYKGEDLYSNDLGVIREYFYFEKDGKTKLIFTSGFNVEKITNKAITVYSFVMDKKVTRRVSFEEICSFEK